MSMRPLRRLRSALRDFLTTETAGGLALIAAAVLAMLLANLPGTAASYHRLLEMRTGPVLAPALGPMTVHLWINDGLMALFFLLVGLEIKRELVDGELAIPSRRRLPAIAAACGMAVPALIYLTVAGQHPGLARGWAIPAATDIAFAIGVMALLGSRVPPALKLFLATVAIVDDMGAVAIIAVGYTARIDWLALGGAAVVAGAMALLGRRRIEPLWPYLLGFALLWLLVLRSGVHATIAGVVAAALVPVARSPGRPDDARSPLHRLEHRLAPWVALAVVPLFGLANAGVGLGGASLATFADPLVIGVALGLFLGKQAGILGGVALAVRLRLARRPRSWRQLWGVALLGGIGFTMSLFVGGLAFPGDAAMIERVKLGVFGGSLLSAAGGYLVLRFATAGRGDG